MTRYFFHIKNGANLIRDEEGISLVSADNARSYVLQSARELCAYAIKVGRELAADAIIIVDEQGEQLTFVPVAEVLPKRLRHL
jgi:hypothetical protein